MATKPITEREAMEMLLARRTANQEDSSAEDETREEQDVISNEVAEDDAEENIVDTEDEISDADEDHDAFDENADDDSAAPESDPDVDDEMEAEDTDESPAIDPPSSWSSEAKARFRELPPDLQATIAENERKRDLDIRRRIDQIAEQRKEAEARKAEIDKLREEYAQRLKSLLDSDVPQPPDETLLDENSEDYDPEEYNRQEARYRKAMRAREKKQAELQKLHEEQAKEWEAQLAEWQREQREYYASHMPALLDEEKGPQLARAILEYGKANGIDEERLKWASATEIHLLDKARRFDMLQNKSRSTEGRLKKVPRTVKPGSGVKEKRISPLERKIRKKIPLTPQEATQLMLERMKGRSRG